MMRTSVRMRVRVRAHDDEGEVERVRFVSKSSSVRSCASFIDPYQRILKALGIITPSRNRISNFNDVVFTNISYYVSR
jgi:hypothetical protein